MEVKDYIVGIDIGSSNVVMAVGTRNEDGTISVAGVEVQEVEGCVKDGEITNYIELGNAIIKAKSALESELGRKLNSAYVGISGRSVYCVRYEDYVDINNKTGCVTENEMRELHSRIEMVVSGGGDAIIDRIPLRYRINDNHDVTNPIGAYGRKLSATYLFVLTGKQQVEFVNRALYRAEMKVSGLCVNPTILPQVLLSEAEREDGVAIVDIGGELTDLSIVKEGKLWYFSSLPIGACSINDDLQEFLRTSKRNVDPLKRKYGSAIASMVPDDVTVPVKTAGNARKQILQRNIAEIAEERLKDIAGFVMRELKASKFYTKIPCGVVLTGGSAYLDNIDKLFARELELEVRLANMINGIDDESQEMISLFPQSVVMGLLCYGANHTACETMPNGAPKEVSNKPTDTPPSNSGNDMFSGVGTDDKREESDELEPKTTPTNEKEVGAEDNVEEKDNTPTTPEEEIVEPKPEKELTPNKKSEGSLWTRIRRWVDDAFTTDELI
jgi:cell division protein FtsA